MDTGDIRDFLKDRDRLARHLGITLLEVSAGGAVAEVLVESCHLNAVDTAHGGTLFALADYAFAAASNSHGRVAVAINVSISFVKAVAVGARLRATARETSLGPKIATYEVTVTDEAGDAVALFQGMVYRKKDPLPLDGA